MFFDDDFQPSDLLFIGGGVVAVFSLFMGASAHFLWLLGILAGAAMIWGAFKLAGRK